MLPLMKNNISDLLEKNAESDDDEAKGSQPKPTNSTDQESAL